MFSSNPVADRFLIPDAPPFGDKNWENLELSNVSAINLKNDILYAGVSEKIQLSGTFLVLHHFIFSTRITRCDQKLRANG